MNLKHKSLLYSIDHYKVIVELDEKILDFEVVRNRDNGFVDIVDVPTEWINLSLEERSECVKF